MLDPRLAVRMRKWEAALALTAEGLPNATLAEPSRQALWAYRSIALAALGRPGTAIEAFSQVNPPLSDHIQVRYHRGLARVAAGDIELAEMDLRGVADEIARHTILSRHIDARLAGRCSRWRARILDLSARILRPDTSLSQRDEPRVTDQGAAPHALEIARRLSARASFSSASRSITVLRVGSR